MKKKNVALLNRLKLKTDLFLSIQHIIHPFDKNNARQLPTK